MQLWMAGWYIMVAWVSHDQRQNAYVVYLNSQPPKYRINTCYIQEYGIEFRS